MAEMMVVSVNGTKNTMPETVPRWPINDVYTHFPHGVAVRVSHHEAMMIQKKYRSVVPMLVKDYVTGYGTRPQLFVARSQGIGDILMLTPALRALHEEGWDVTLAVMTQFMTVVERNPYIAHVIGCAPNEMPETKISNRVDLNMKVERPAKDMQMPRADLFAKLMRITVPADKKHPILVLSPSDQSKAKRLLGKRHWIGMAVRTSTSAKNYPHMYELAELLAKKGKNVVLLHHESEAKTGVNPQHANILNLQAQTTVGEMCAIIERCKVFVSGDSGPMHVALTLKTPCVAIEGPLPARIYHSSYAASPVRVVSRNDMKCLGCGHNGKWMACSAGIEQQRPYECMRIPPETVAAAIEEVTA